MIPPHSEAAPHSYSFHPTWSHALAHPPRGLVLAREKGWVLAWDSQDWLYLLNPSGERQSQMHSAAKLTTASCADNGLAYAAGGAHGEIWWLLPDLRTRWERSVGHSVTALALDSFGQYLAVGDSLGTLTIFDSQGRQLVRAQSQRPLHHLTFIPAAPYLVGASDYGLIACFDLNGKLIWRDGIVAHIGALSISGTGEKIVLACFSEGLQQYDVQGNNLGRQSLPEAARLAALTYDARHLLAAGMGNHLLWVDAQHRILSTHQLEKPAVAMGLSPLGDRIIVAQAESSLVGLDLRPSLHS
jgi:WD40 repeat protein